MKSINKRVSTSRAMPALRKTALASALALGGLLGAAANAQTTSYVFTTGTPSTHNAATALSLYVWNVLNDQINMPPLTIATINGNNTLGATFVGGGAVNITETNNSLLAEAAGNRYNLSPAFDLSTLGTGDALGMLSAQIQGGNPLAPVAVNTVVTNSNIAISLTNKPVGTMVLNQNSITANTQLNEANQSAAGDLPLGYSSAQSGSIQAGSTPAGVVSNTVTGGVTMVNNQMAMASGMLSGSDARVTNSTVSITANNTTGNFDQSSTLNRNSISANFGGNLASNVFNPTSGSVNGSVAVSNSQANVEFQGADPGPTALVDNSGIFVDHATGASTSQLSSSITASSNSITASSTGNSAVLRDSSGALTHGNAIVLSDGVEMTGPAQATDNTLTIGASTLTASVDANLALFNGQGNQNTALFSRVNNAQVQVTGDGITATGALTVNRNTIGSDATGNLAMNLIQSGASNLSASVAAANLQANDATPITAQTNGSSIGVTTGDDNFSIFGSTTVNRNAITAAATGSSAQTVVQLNSSNLTVPGTTVGAVAGTSGFGDVQATAGVTVSNLQGNYGAATTISAGVSSSNVRATFADATTGFTESLNTAAVTVNNNTIGSAATGNTALSSMALGTTDDGTTNVSGTGAVGNQQFNGNNIDALTTGSGVTVTAYSAFNSAISASQNTVSSSALANGATNAITSIATNVDVPTVGAVGATVSSVTGDSTSGGALAIASGQRNEGITSSLTTSGTPFVQVDVTPGLVGPGIETSNVTVNGNTVSSTTMVNQVNNSIGIAATNLSTATGAAGPVASISNLQENSSQALTSDAAVRNTGTGQMLGIVFDGVLDTANLAVSKNTAEALAVGNSAANQMTISAQNYSSTGAFGGTISSTAAGVSTATSEFSLVNRQIDLSRSRSAEVDTATIGVNTGGFGGSLTDANITVNSNIVNAEARNNDSFNQIALTGAMDTGGALTNIKTGAAALNEQSGVASVTATVTDARLRISQVEPGVGITGSNLTMSKNTVQGLAVGNSSTVRVLVDAANITGNSAATGATSVNLASGDLGTSSDFGAANKQTQSGPLNSSVESSLRINLDGNTAVGGSVTMKDNAVNSVALSNSGATTVALNGTNVVSSAAAASYQSGTGSVTASQTTQASEFVSFGMIGTATDGTPVVINNNKILVAGGQNEAFNTVSVTATNLTGKGFNNPSAYVAGVATSGADFSAVNVQTGVGSISATANPRVIGTQIGTIEGSGVTINGNAVTARATVNTAGNKVLLDGGSVLNATGAVNNVQTSTAGSGVNATINATSLGVVQHVAPASDSNLLDTNASVNGNTLNAIAGGNSASNALDATATSSIASSVAAPTFAVLNYQSNAAAMTAAVNSASVGIITGATGSINGTNATVNNNSVSAFGYGNNSVNTLGMTSLIANGNASTSLVSNTQLNTANISSTVTSATIGVIGGASTGSSFVIGGNSVTASSVGNSAVNSIVAK